MADFHQEGVITTLHALHETFNRDEYVASLERRLDTSGDSFGRHGSKAKAHVKAPSFPAGIS